jgi:hypothetical protein
MGVFTHENHEKKRIGLIGLIGLIGGEKWGWGKLRNCGL